jgi:hypothetical protein
MQVRVKSWQLDSRAGECHLQYQPAAVLHWQHSMLPTLSLAADAAAAAAATAVRA